MKKTKLFDKSIQDKQYDASLLILKLVASVVNELKILNSQVKEQNDLIKNVLANIKTEDQSV